MTNPPQTNVSQRVVAVTGEPTDGQVAAWNATTQQWEPITPSGSTPSGTGFRHVTSGTEDGSATAVVSIAQGGTGATTAADACIAILPTVDADMTMLAWNGTAWALIDPPTVDGQVLTYSSGSIRWVSP